jgi:L-fuconolactonase
MNLQRIDAHHHLWRYTDEEFGWIDAGMKPLRRDFLLDDLRAELKAAGVSGTVAVQARQTVEETRWLLEIAAQEPQIRGVVGWLPIGHSEFAETLEEFAGYERLKGLRHVVQAEAPGFLDHAAFNAGIARMLGTGLVYDVLIFARQLDEAIRFVDRYPQQMFVVDHVAKPSIATGEIDQWAAGMRELARRENMSCKVSGMVTEADFRNWTAEDLKPYFEVVLEAFGPQRLMVGTDWPVLTVGCTYKGWWDVVESWIAPLTETERAAIAGGTAIKVYGLKEQV